MVQLFFALLMLASLAGPACSTEAGWALVRDGGEVVLIRHGRVTGASDPASFDIANCRTQRNLSETGGQQARRMGALFAARAAPIERVLSSRACRCLDTARLAFEDTPIEPFPPLDPLRGSAADNAAKTKAVMAEIRAYSGSGNLVLVTDEENIKALTGSGAREGEALIVQPAGETLHVLAHIVFN